MSKVEAGFQAAGRVIALNRISPLKTLRPTELRGVKFKQILVSIEAVGIVEPPMVIEDPSRPDHYLLLDGHLRIEALRSLGFEEAACLLSKDDETYTYNKRINRLSAAQEHRMVLRAIDRGVPEADLAKALGLDISAIRRRARLMNGIAPEVQTMLGDHPVAMVVFDTLRMMGPLRQIEVADLMIGQGNFSHRFARALLAATPDHARATVPSRPAPMSAKKRFARMEQELSVVQTKIRAIEENFGRESLQLTVAKGYLTRLLNSGKIVQWLAAHRPEYLREFQAVVGITSLDPTPGETGKFPVELAAG